MSSRKVCRHYIPYTAIYDQDDIPRDEVVANMTARIDMLVAQMVELLIE